MKTKYIFGKRRGHNCVVNLDSGKTPPRTVNVVLMDVPEESWIIKLYGRTWKVTNVAFADNGTPNITAKLSH
jgi:hypothetical protein